MRWTIARIERSRPPGVSSWITSACARSAWARSMAMPTRRRVTGLITPSISIVDGERAVDRPAARASEPFGDPGRALLLHGLDAGALDPVLVVELEVLRAVERAADSDLDHPSGVDEPFLDGSAKRRPVEVLR